MFGIRTKSARLDDFGFLAVDVHNHVLPGIDDGAADLEASLALVYGLGTFGFVGAYATPHVMVDLYPNTDVAIEGALDTARRGLREARNGMFLHAAAEYYLDEGFDDLLDAGTLRTLPGERVLIEWSPMGEPVGLGTYVSRLRDAGYTPVIAHPERYRYWRGDLAKWRELTAMGCELQVNLLSLSGHYGDGARAAALALLTGGYAAFAASDAHKASHVRELAAVLGDREAAAALRGGGLRNAELAAY